jgi:tetratricopeptide (TPR) repeat protein
MRTLRIVQATSFAGLALATWLFASHLDTERLRPYDVGIVPKASTLRWLSLGHPTLAANLLWLKAVQYIGDPRANERGWDKLYPLTDAVTDLDPRHAYAYYVAGTLLSAFDHVPESNAILEKGTQALPDRYILPYQRAFNAFYYDDDWATAGRFAEISARAPGAPAHVRQNVLAYYVKGQRADAAVAFLEQSLAEAKDPETRKAVEAQIGQAMLERDAVRVDEAIGTWRSRYVIGPLSLQQLVTEKLLAEIPADPHGGELYVDEDGRVRSTANPYRFSKPEPVWTRIPRPRPDKEGTAP